MGGGGVRRPSPESWSVGQKQHLYRPPPPLSCHNTIKKTVRFGGEGTSAWLIAGWINIKVETHTLTHTEQSSRVDPAARLRSAYSLCVWLSLWPHVTCLPSVFPPQTAPWPSSCTSLWFSSDTSPSSSSSSVWALLLLILLLGPQRCVQLWPSQGAHAGAHLTGPWPQDDSQQQHVPYMRDKATQVSVCVCV